MLGKLLTISALGLALTVAPISAEQKASSDAAQRQQMTSPTTSQSQLPDRSESASQPGQAGTASSSDQQFIRQAAMSGHLETTIGRLGQERAQNEQVRQFAAELLREHQQANARLKGIADKLGVEIREDQDLDAMHTEKVNRLENAARAQFDQQFIRDQIQHHRQNIAQFERVSTSAESGQVRQFARESLPVLRRHLAQAEQLAPTLGIRDMSPDRSESTRSFSDTSESPTGNVTDQQFLRRAAMGCMLETRLAKLAQDRAQNDQVRQYGAELERDHQQGKQRLMGIAEQLGLKIKADQELDSMHAGIYTRLENAPQAQFDQQFIRNAIENRRKDIAQFERVSTSAESEQVRLFAQETLPVLRRHLEQAQKLASTVGIRDMGPDRGERSFRDRAESGTQRQHGVDPITGRDMSPWTDEYSNRSIKLNLPNGYSSRQRSGRSERSNWSDRSEQSMDTRRGFSEDSQYLYWRDRTGRLWTSRRDQPGVSTQPSRSSERYQSDRSEAPMRHQGDRYRSDRSERSETGRYPVDSSERSDGMQFERYRSREEYGSSTNVRSKAATTSRESDFGDYGEQSHGQRQFQDRAADQPDRFTIDSSGSISGSTGRDIDRQKPDAELRYRGNLGDERSYRYRQNVPSDRNLPDSADRMYHSTISPDRSEEMSDMAAPDRAEDQMTLRARRSGLERTRWNAERETLYDYPQSDQLDADSDLRGDMLYENEKSTYSDTYRDQEVIPEEYGLGSSARTREIQR